MDKKSPLTDFTKLSASGWVSRISSGIARPTKYSSRTGTVVNGPTGLSQAQAEFCLGFFDKEDLLGQNRIERKQPCALLAKPGATEQLNRFISHL
jgi:hypothetical protein